MATHGSYRNLTLQILAAMALGVLFGHFLPETAQGFKPLGDAFIKLIKMAVGPVIFLSIVGSLASLENLSGAGKIGAKALLYFLAVSTLSLIIGAAVAHLFQPGAGMHVALESLSTEALRPYLAQTSADKGAAAFVLGIIPTTPVSAFAEGNLLQILFFSVLFAVAAALTGDRAAPVLRLVDDLSQVFVSIIALLMRLAPLGVFGALSYTVGAFGIRSVVPLASLMACFYVTSLIFVFGVLAAILRLCGLRLWPLLRLIKDELLIVFGTSSSETVLPRLIEKLKSVGCDKAVAGIVVPSGYSFNLDGTAIYLSMAAIFLAQATDTPLTFGQEAALLAAMMLASKGAAGVTGSGFITLTATLSAFGEIPVAAAVLILGIDRFMSEARALVNVTGNAVAALVVARWEGKLDLNLAAPLRVKA